MPDQDAKAKPVLAEWRGDDETGCLIFSAEAIELGPDVMMNVLGSLAVYSIAHIIDTAPEGDDTALALELVKKARAFAREGLGTVTKWEH